MDIRKLTHGDLQEVLALVEKVFMEFEAPAYPEEGIKNFLNFIKIENIINCMNSSDIRMELWGCYINEQVVGVLAVRSVFHISLLFVDKSYHKQGIARALLQAYMDEIREDVRNQGWNLNKQLKITVNSSPYAVPIYERMGFYKVKESMTKDGIHFTPMVKEM